MTPAFQVSATPPFPSLSCPTFLGAEVRGGGGWAEGGEESIKRHKQAKGVGERRGWAGVEELFSTLTCLLACLRRRRRLTQISRSLLQQQEGGGEGGKER